MACDGCRRETLWTTRRKRVCCSECVGGGAEDAGHTWSRPCVTSVQLFSVCLSVTPNNSLATSPFEHLIRSFLDFLDLCYISNQSGPKAQLSRPSSPSSTRQTSLLGSIPFICIALARLSHGQPSSTSKSALFITQSSLTFSTCKEKLEKNTSWVRHMSGEEFYWSARAHLSYHPSDQLSVRIRPFVTLHNSLIQLFEGQKSCRTPGIITKLCGKSVYPRLSLFPISARFRYSKCSSLIPRYRYLLDPI